MDFIYQKPKAMSPEFCTGLIELFENNPELQISGTTGHNAVNQNFKKSIEIPLNPSYFDREEWNPFITNILETLSTGLQEYRKTFSFDGDHGIAGIDGLAGWRVDWSFNIQKYNPGDGYYVWHCETPNGTYPSVARMLTWMIYLNDVENGGTEFKFQDTTVDAEQGKLVLWPPYWTHFHRGVINNTQTKYIVTGWCSYVNEE